MPAFNYKTQYNDSDQHKSIVNLKELASSSGFSNRLYQLESPVQLTQKSAVNETEEACKFEFVRVQRQIISSTEQGEERVILLLIDTSI